MLNNGDDEDEARRPHTVPQWLVGFAIDREVFFMRAFTCLI